MLRPGLIMIVVVGEAGDVNQTIDQQLVELHEKTEIRHTCDHPIKFLAGVTVHVFALEPCLDVPCRFLGTAFMRGRNRPEPLHRTGVVVIAPGFATAQDMADRPVNQQIRIATNWRREVRVRIQR